MRQQNRSTTLIAFVLLVALLAYYVYTRLPVGLFGAAATPAIAPAPAPAGVMAAPSGLPALGSELRADFYLEFRLDRERARGHELELLREVIHELAADDQVKAEAARRYIDLGRRAALELELEHLIRARGFTEAVVHLGDGGAQVVVRAARLSPEQVRGIAEVMIKSGGAAPEDIVILSRP